MNTPSGSGKRRVKRQQHGPIGMHGDDSHDAWNGSQTHFGASSYTQCIQSAAYYAAAAAGRSVHTLT